MNQSSAFIAAILGMSVFAMPAIAQDADDADRQVKYAERTEIDFDDMDVTGELVKPRGQAVMERRKASFNPLIRLRENFNPEMKQSVDEVK